jgi:hypothetical protein
MTQEHELVEVRAISKDDLRKVRAVAEVMTMALFDGFGDDVFVIEVASPSSSPSPLRSPPPHPHH